MNETLHLRDSDVIGFSRLANDGVAGVTDMVEALHGEIAAASVGLVPQPDQELAADITALVYDSIRGITRLIGKSLIASEPLLEKQAPPERVSLGREAVVAAVNGVLGDYLVRTKNPLAISMCLRRHGRALEIERHALKARLRRATGKVLVLAHGLCLNDLQWKRKGHDHGAALADEFGYTPVYLHYNSGLHVSENGRALASLLEKLVEQWPVEVEEISIIGHSMGGLVARSAHQYGTQDGHGWIRHLRKIVFLGTPHHGAPLEQLGNWVDTALEISSYSAPFARLGKVRSAGITDMRYGNVMEQDWKGRDRFAAGTDARIPPALPRDVQCYAMAATRQSREMRGPDLLGDGLVTVDSALGQHANPAMRLRFDASHQWIGYGMNHWDLLSDASVYEQIRRSIRS